MKRLLLFLLLLVAVNATMSAYDFEVDGKYYNLLSDSTAEFTCRDPNYTAYRGHLVIPETVSYNGVDLTVTQVSDYACYKCRQMTSVSIPNTVTSLGVSSFLGCSGLTSIDIPNHITSIDEYAFARCVNLTHVTLPDSITNIADYMFYECGALESITIPAPVTDIGLSAFRYCNNLTQVISLPVTPPAITQYCFINSYGATLFVPQESMEAYSTHEFWGRFSRIVPFLGAGPGDVNGDGTITVSDAVDIINHMLDAGNAELPAYCDVNGDGTVNIADITILINMLLNATN